MKLNKIWVASLIVSLCLGLSIPSFAALTNDARHLWPGQSYIGDQVQDAIELTTAIKDEAETITGDWTFTGDNTYDDIDIPINKVITFGDGAFTAKYVSADSTLYIYPDTDDYVIQFGEKAATQLSVDLLAVGNTSADTIEFDASGNIVNMTNIDMLFGEDDAINFYDTAVNIQAADDGHLDLTADTSIDLNSDVTCSGHVDGNTFMVNTFLCPAPGADWTPSLDGADLPDAKTAKVMWIPLDFLKIGDEIVSYQLVGDVTEASTTTVDAQIYRINKADPLTTTAITGGAMTQVDADGEFDVLTTLSAVETVATDKQYVIQVTGTTTSSDAITVMGAEVVVNRKL